MIENLKTETLIDLRNQIDEIIKNRQEDEENWIDSDMELSREEKEKLDYERWKAMMEEFQERLPAFIKACKNYNETRRPVGTVLYTWDPVPEHDMIKWHNIVDVVIKNNCLVRYR